MTRLAEQVVSRIQNAGSVFVGPWTSKSSGDYATGANHILPTGGMAKMYPPLGVDSFGKWMQVQKCTKAGLQRIQKTIETMSDIEELPAHKQSTRIRFEKTI
jgi:histidinol dehydrogenase